MNYKTCTYYSRKMTASGMCRRSLIQLSLISRSVFFRNNKSCCRQLSNVATENNRNGNPEPHSPPKPDGVDQAIGDTEVEETHQAEPVESEAEKVLKEEKQKLQKELDSTKDKYMRALAETENVRQRLRKQIDETKVFGIQSFCKDLLEVADILGQATQSTPKEEITKNEHLKALYEGLTLTNTQLLKVFARHELLPIVPSEGEKFDPFLHEAMFQVPAQEKEKDGNIAVIQKTGYKLKDRTLRPAQVGVFKTS